MNDNTTVKLDDGGEPTTSSDPLIEHQAELPSKPVVSAPRSLWFEFFLGLFTFSISWCFWSVARARDIKRMRFNSYTPWLWFFVPLLVVASLFAFLRMFAELRVIEGDRVNAAWKTAGGLWIALFVIFGVLANLPDSLVGEWWIVFVCLGFSHALLCLLHLRFNRLKVHDQEYLEFTGRVAWYAWWEWLLMAVLVLTMSVAGYSLWEDDQSVLESLPANYHHQDTERGFQLHVNGHDWQKVIIGTYSNGEAVIEFANASRSAYLMVFEQEDKTLDSMASFRYGDMVPDFDSAPSCDEVRELNESQTSIESESLCLSETGQHHEMSVSKLIKVGDLHYELLGFLSDSKQSYKKIKKTLLMASKSFSEASTEQQK